jgi:hypothetical protein
VSDHLYAQRYRLVEALPPGRALARHRAVDAAERPLIITVLTPRDPGAFARHMGLVAAARHLNLAAVVDVGGDELESFVVSEDVRGDDAETLVAQGPLPVGAATMIGAEAAAGLAALHAQGAVHGGVEPGSLVQATDGTVKLTDAGIAAALSPPDLRPGAPAANARYLSPEEAAGRPAEPACDVYRLGLVLYRLLTGTHAFDGPDAATVAREQIDGVAQPPQFRNPQVPPAVAQIVLRALDKDPSRRGSAAQLQHDLSEVLGSTRVVAPPPEKPRSQLWVWVVVAVVVAALAAVAIAFATGVFGGSQDVEVPSVVGKTLAAATNTLTQAELAVGTVRDVQGAGAEAGTVVKQNPSAGQSVPEHTRVNLEVAAGPSPSPSAVAVPGVVGASQATAQANLTAAGFVVVVTQQPSDTVASGTVISQSPSGGVVAARGSTVTIVVSSGASPTASPTVSPSPSPSP